ncbi:putative Group 1 truncated hemoglobin GlbN [Candidatus Terasakiella magnetica]|uniref:Putative Group 1 truncated hemoglobin GlbN n=1 Tax=Candidatus Terasakiella magnetica TaxID=1867952 RepID=A0A1C3RFG1_9PROT|nr:group 1 truncated hemoglobin [Candidatus Terasakiella magnetica]SCA55962.1 putative Group 1 truncated hemoglobin GlbN [Candidatus Terasakiella magnetica]
MASLYIRLGGEPAMEALAEFLYERIALDEDLNRFFKNMDFAAQQQKQVDFLSDIFGGPKLDHELDLRAVHRPLVARGMNESHFNKVAEHVIDILREMHTEESDITAAIEKIATFKDDILDQ